MRSFNYTAEFQTEFEIQVTAKNAVLVDVRDPSEYAEYSLLSSINIPSSKIDFERFDSLKSKEIILICNTGVRAVKVAKKLDLLGFNNIQLAVKHLNSIDPKHFHTSKGGKAVKARWSVDRQFRMTLGIFLLVFLLLTRNNVSWAYMIPMTLAVGLISTSIIDRCYLRLGIGLLPWNR